MANETRSIFQFISGLWRGAKGMPTNDGADEAEGVANSNDMPEVSKLHAGKWPDGPRPRGMKSTAAAVPRPLRSV